MLVIFEATKMIFCRTPFGDWWIQAQTTEERALLDEAMKTLERKHPFGGLTIETHPQRQYSMHDEADLGAQR